MKYYIIAGEASGDLHASNLIEALRGGDPHGQFRAWGGDLMAAAGAEVVMHYRDLAFMGFAEVIANIRTIKRNLDFCKADILAFKPDVVILVDYPGFNLRIAKFAHVKGFKVFYYISPQVWAWKENRVRDIKAFVDEMFVILPFEKDWYATHDVQVHFAGHPLLDAVERMEYTIAPFGKFCANHNLSPEPIVALLPGSRKQEIKRMLPLMLQAGQTLKGCQVVVAAAPSQPLSYYQGMLKCTEARVVQGATYELLHHSHAAMVTSGTATLETALFKVPQVVCYKGGAISYQIAKALVKVPYISLVNLIMNREVVKELIQNQLTAPNLEAEINRLCNDEVYRQAMLDDYQALAEKLGGSGASQNVANLMLKKLGLQPASAL